MSYEVLFFLIRLSDVVQPIVHTQKSIVTETPLGWITRGAIYIGYAILNGEPVSELSV